MTLKVNKGDKYGDYTVIRPDEGYSCGEGGKRKFRVFLCKCKCGKKQSIRLIGLRNGRKVNCGCDRKGPKDNDERTISKIRGTRYVLGFGLKVQCGSQYDAQEYVEEKELLYSLSNKKCQI